MNMSPDDHPRPPGVSAADRVSMQGYRMNEETIYPHDAPAPRVVNVQQTYQGYDEDLRPRARNNVAIFLGLGLLGGALLGGALFFLLSPSSPTMVEKQVEVVAVAPVLIPSPPVNMTAPVAVIAPAPVAVIAPPPPPPPLPVVEAPPLPAPVIVAPPTPVVVVAPPPPPVPVVVIPSFTLPRGEINALMARAKSAMSEGDISLARTYLDRVARTNDGLALFMLGETYDPERLRVLGARGVRADVKKARDYYTQALAQGEEAARSRLEALR